MTVDAANTFADGLATRATYDLTWAALTRWPRRVRRRSRDAQIAEAIRVLIRTTHNLAEGAGAAGLAGLFALREQLAGKTVAIVLSRLEYRRGDAAPRAHAETSDGAHGMVRGCFSVKS